MNMGINFCGIPMKNPVIAASGTFGFGLEYKDYVDLNRAGAISMKGLSAEPWEGNAGVRIAETPGGMLNAIGLENPGVQVFLDRILPRIREYDVPVICNIVGSSVEDYGKVAEALSVPGVSALEVNISCPNVKNGCLAFGIEEEGTAAVTRMVKQHTDLPVIVKLSPNVTDIVPLALAAEEAGADGLSLINTLLGIAVDIKKRRPVLGNITGGLSGPAVKPVALRMVWQASHAVHIPICGMGGIMTGTDAVEFMMAGASAVQVGTATLIDPRAMACVTEELEAWCTAEGIDNVSALTGAMKTE
jgi:dihydroorotate dehydrogenase (NAD+) catalytic subunit